MLSDKEAIILVGLSKKQIQDLPKNITGITRTNSTKELAEIYTASDVFFNPTLEETLGLTNIEAQACGTPVITFNTGGSIETIDNSTGFIVEKGDLENTIRIIRKIKSEGKEKYSDSCIKRANKYYNKDEKFQEYIELYKNLIKNKIVTKEQQLEMSYPNMMFYVSLQEQKANETIQMYRAF
jgi:glycosyltransferase involved in cell wall biosynthesis